MSERTVGALAGRVAFKTTDQIAIGTVSKAVSRFAGGNERGARARSGRRAGGNERGSRARSGRRVGVRARCRGRSHLGWRDGRKLNGRLEAGAVRAGRTVFGNGTRVPRKRRLPCLRRPLRRRPRRLRGGISACRQGRGAWRSRRKVRRSRRPGGRRRGRRQRRRGGALRTRRRLTIRGDLGISGAGACHRSGRCRPGRRGHAHRLDHGTARWRRGGCAGRTGGKRRALGVRARRQRRRRCHGRGGWLRRERLRGRQGRLRRRRPRGERLRGRQGRLRRRRLRGERRLRRAVRLSVPRGGGAAGGGGRAPRPGPDLAAEGGRKGRDRLADGRTRRGLRRVRRHGRGGAQVSVEAGRRRAPGRASSPGFQGRRSNVPARGNGRWRCLVRRRSAGV